MYYNPGTGSYCNDFMEHIADTEFRTDVPYKIDKQKYDEILRKYNEGTRFHDSDVVTFSMDYSFHGSSEGEDGETPYMYGFFAFPEKAEGSKDFYDCILFHDYEYDNKHKEAYENFVRELMGSVIGVDIPTATREKEKLAAELKKNLDDFTEFEAIIKLAEIKNGERTKDKVE
jgi:hypothetical protein